MRSSIEYSSEISLERVESLSGLDQSSNEERYNAVRPRHNKIERKSLASLASFVVMLDYIGMFVSIKQTIDLISVQNAVTESCRKTLVSNYNGKDNF